MDPSSTGGTGGDAEVLFRVTRGHLDAEELAALTAALVARAAAARTPAAPAPLPVARWHAPAWPVGRPPLSWQNAA